MTLESIVQVDQRLSSRNISAYAALGAHFEALFRDITLEDLYGAEATTLTITYQGCEKIPAVTMAHTLHLQLETPA